MWVVAYSDCTLSVLYDVAISLSIVSYRPTSRALWSAHMQKWQLFGTSSQWQATTDTTFKVKRSRSPGRFTHRRVGASGSCSGGRGNVLAVRNYCYVAVCSAERGTSAPTGEERGGAYRGGRPAYSLSSKIIYLQLCIKPQAYLLYFTIFHGSENDEFHRSLLCS